MHLTMLKSKLHHARVTHAELEYEGSCAIDGRLLDTAGIREYEQIHVYNLANGERFTTYAIRAADGSGIVSVNGAAAHKARPGHRVIICAFATLAEHELTGFRPVLVHLDDQNRVLRVGSEVPVQVA